MAPYFWPTTLLICAALSLGVGLAGLLRSQSVIRDSGRNTLMHYPAPWLKNRLTAAKWVQWIGHLYIVTGLCLAALAFGLGLQEPQQNHRWCNRIGEAILQSPWSDSGWTHQTMIEQPDHCHTRILDNQGTRWLSIQSNAPHTLLGEGYRNKTQEIERSGMALKPISRLGNRAVMATPRSKGQANPLIIIDGFEGVHTVEMNGLKLDATQREPIIDVIRETLAAVEE
jgi:hypothetical protein